MTYNRNQNRQSCQRLDDNKSESKRVHFHRQITVFILRRHVHLCAQDVLCLHIRDCDVCAVVVEGFSDAKVANAALTASVQQHVGALDVTVNDTHLECR